MRIVFFAFTLTLFSGCSSYTILRSNPDGADVYIDGKHMGKTPFVYEDRKVSFAKTEIRLEKIGFKPLESSIRRNGHLNIATFTLGSITLVPLIWAVEYAPEHAFDLSAD